MSRLPLLAVVSVVCALACTSELFAASRGIVVDLRTAESPDAPVAETVELYTSSHALVIGIDDYTNGWPKLSNAIKDAELIAAQLEIMGFEVELHKNLTSAELATVFKRFFILKGSDPGARLFIWFAGHGDTVDEEGYLVPADAPIPSAGGGADFKFAAVALRDFGTFMRQAVSKHVYAVFDSCFAGTVFSSQRALPPAAITRATTLPVRQFLTSGDAEQTVSDDGTFRELFIRAINGDERADSNGDGYVTASELGMFLGDRVTNLTQSIQTPRFGKLRDRNFDRGDFVFALPGGTVAGSTPTAPAGASNGAEIAFWNSIKDSGSVSQYDAYLSQYPTGSFAALAMVRKNEITRKQEEARQRARASETFRVALVDQDMLASGVANVRETPFPTAERVAQLEPGAVVWVVGETQTSGGTWYKIARDGVELGFVYGPLLEHVSSNARLVSVEPAPFKPAELIVSADASVVAAADPTPGQQLSFLVEDLLQEVTSVAAAPVSRGLPKQSGQAIAPEPTAPVPMITPTAEETVPVQSGEQGAMMQTGFSPAANVASSGASLPATAAPTLSPATSESAFDEAAPAPAMQMQLAATTQAGTEAAVATLTPSTPSQEPAASESASEAPVKAPAMQVALVTPAPNPVEAEPEVSDFIKRYLSAARQGNSKAQMSLGYMYETGEHVAVDKAEAVRWYTRAAEGGETEAMVSLALMYDAGEGVAMDPVESAVWYRKAATAGHADAQQTLAYRYENGMGVTKDMAEAARWYEKAALQGRVAAQNNLGRFYQLGIGVPQDADQAIFWYERAAAQGSQAAQDNLKQLLP